jgi:hypothetical protein
MLIFWAAQFLLGMHEHNNELDEHHKQALTAAQYITSGHFMSTTFENWESEFLQMALYVMLTVRLRQKGSSESRKLKGDPGADEEEVDRDPVPKEGAPWPVRKGGLWLRLYSNSLSICFTLLFLLSFSLHFIGSLKDNNEEQLIKGKQITTAAHYIVSSRFWFESFQNWQSEFLAVAAIVLLSIWFRQKGSPESKPVDAPYAQTGD